MDVLKTIRRSAFVVFALPIKEADELQQKPKQVISAEDLKVLQDRLTALPTQDEKDELIEPHLLPDQDATADFDVAYRYDDNPVASVTSFRFQV